jgi:DNA-binding NarL/FixJ family response regulator
MDYWMAKLNGGTACRNIVAKHPSARVILVSGWVHLKDVDYSGAVGILSKPVDIYQLEHALNNAVAQTSDHIRALPEVEHLGIVGVVETADQTDNVFWAAAS